MKIDDAIKTRKSIRGFKPDSVPKEVLQELLQTAVQSPSAMNTQPWRLHVIDGNILAEVGKENVNALASGTMPKLEIQMEENYQGVYKKRQVDLAKQLFQLMEIAREDQQARFEWMQRGFRFFDAPAAIVLCYEKEMESSSCLVHYDLGVIAHAICLTALEYDLGTCIHGQGAMYPQNLRKHVNIPVTETIFNCISIGYPDWDFAANKVESERDSFDNCINWAGF